MKNNMYADHLMLEDDDKLHLKETGCEDVDCIHMTQDRVQW
jgi:hypothetical protein